MMGVLSLLASFTGVPALALLNWNERCADRSERLGLCTPMFYLEVFMWAD